MKSAIAFTLLCATSAWALDQGELQFSVAGKTYSTAHAQAVVHTQKGRTRIYIAVKDVTQRFMLLLSADVEKGSETKPLFLTTEDSNLSISLRTAQGALAILPYQQMAKPTALEYTERVDVDSGQWEDDPNEAPETHGHHHGHKKERRKRKKIRSEYRKVKPRWHTMTRQERLASGEGVIQNGTFKDTYFVLQLTPVVSANKVVSFTGTFSGSGRFSRSIAGAEVKPVQNGAFNVRVENVP